MGLVYKEITEFLPSTIDGDHVFVEIGSDRGEGSTVYLDMLSQQYQTKLYSVDILPDAKTKLDQVCLNTEFVVSPGSTWAKSFALKKQPISVLYLDNFDYTWNINAIDELRYWQELYHGLGLTMTNQQCQIEHLEQMIALAGNMHHDGVIVFDDTFRFNDCWIGKCGPAVVYMMTLGWKVVWDHKCGVIMRKVDKFI